MKNNEVGKLLNQLSKTSFTEVKNGKFQYALAKNRNILKRELEIIQKSIEQSRSEELISLINEIRPEILKQIDEKNKEIMKENQKRTEDGRSNRPPLSVQQKIEIENEIIANWEKGEEYRKLANEFLTMQEDILQQECDINLHMITLDLIEELPLNDVQMNAVFTLIK